MTEPAGPRLRSWIVFSIPDDPKLLAAFGTVTIRHSQLDHVLRMTIKSLTEVSVEEALDATARAGSAELRDRIKKLARQRLGEGAALVRLQALIERCRRLTEQRNEYTHSVWGREMDGDHTMRAEDHSWGPIPTATELEKFAGDLYTLTNELNDARLTGFLAEALFARAKP